MLVRGGSEMVVRGGSEVLVRGVGFGPADNIFFKKVVD